MTDNSSASPSLLFGMILVNLFLYSNAVESFCSNLHQGHFPLRGIFRAERHFLLFKDQLPENGRQKTKENIIPGEKLRLVENSLNAAAIT